MTLFVATLVGRVAEMPNAELFTIEPPIKRYGVDFGQIILSTSDLVQEQMLFLARDGKVAVWTEVKSRSGTVDRGVLLTDIGAIQIRSANHRRRIAEIGMNAFLAEYIPTLNAARISALEENYKRFVLHQD